jgi:hypothetical protein
LGEVVGSFRNGLLAVCAVLAVVAVTGCAGETEPDADAAAAGTVEQPVAAESSPAVEGDPVTVSAPGGVWTLRSKVTASNNTRWAKLGFRETRTWKFRPDCDSASSCGGRIKSSSGNAFDYSWDGEMLTIVRETPIVEEGPCSDQEGRVVRGTHSKATAHYPPVVFRPAGRDSAEEGAPTRLQATTVERAVVTELRGGCRNGFAGTGSPRPKSTHVWIITEGR